MFYKYPKIEGLWERDPETRKVIEGLYRNDTIRYAATLKWAWTEKVDGTNVGIVWDGHKVTFQGRTEKTEHPRPLLRALENIFGGKDAEEIFETLFGEKTVVLYGEGYGGKIQKAGKTYRETESFILFDVYLPDNDLWLKRDALSNIAYALNIELVPVVFVGTVEEAVEIVKNKRIRSTFEGAEIEGLVGKPIYELRDRERNRLVVKVKGRDYK